MNSSYISPFAKPVYIMLKPIGSVCNLACEYCYYLEKSKFYPDVKNHIMTDTREVHQGIHGMPNHARSLVYMAWRRDADAADQLL